MSSFPGGDWHNFNGGGLPFRPPPTVDEALPYSPFTSVVPFSADIIPFPVLEPPTPSTSLTVDQQTAARKAVGILNDEINDTTSTAQHLENTLRELRNLLGDPCDMTQFCFKRTAQLATPPPESASEKSNGTTPTKPPKLSPFADMLLKQSKIQYLPTPTPPSPPQLKPELSAPRQAPPLATSRTTSQAKAPTPPHTPHEKKREIQYPSDTPASSAKSASSRSGPVVIIKPSNVPREEYRLYDKIPTDDKKAEQKKDFNTENILTTLRPQEREIAENKINVLQKLVRKLYDAKDELDSDYFERVSCEDSDITAMTRETLDRVYDRVMIVCATGCFSSVTVENIKRIQSLCEPWITASDRTSHFRDGESTAWANDLVIVECGLKASKLVLTTMLEGPKDRSISPEDILTAIIQVIKRVLDNYIIPVLESRRSGDSELFAYASTNKQEMITVIRLSTSVQALVAQAIGKVPISDGALNAVEHLALGLLVQQNSDSEKDSVLGIQRFEKLRQAAMDVLTQIFASHQQHQQYLTSEILNNLEKLPDKGPNARQFKSVREEPIMTVSALFMRFIQVAATNPRNEQKKASSMPHQDDSADDSEIESDYESGRPFKAKTKPKGNNSAQAIARRSMENTRVIAHRIATTLTERALNVSKSGEKPFRNLLDMFVEDFCKVLGSPEWPAATLLLLLLLGQMVHLLGEKTPNNNNKDMALSILGTMGGGIIDFKLRIRQLKRDVDISQSNLSSQLNRLVEDTLDGEISKNDLLSLKGPYRMVIESLPDYLRINDNRDDPHMLSIEGCYVTFWLDSLAKAIQSIEKEGSDMQPLRDIQQSVEIMILDAKWSSREYKYQNVSEMQSRLAAGILTLQSDFCRYYPGILNIMFRQIQDGGVTQKSKALRNIESFLNKDAQAIPENLVKNVTNLLHDSSPLVRADAVSLVSRCLDANPAMERLCLHGVMSLTTDPSNGPKKKAITLLKKIYLNSKSLDHKLGIVASLLPASQDHEKSIAEMARQALEEVWLKVLNANGISDENRLKLKRAERVSLLVQTVRRAQGSPKYLEAFEKFFSSALTSTSPAASVNFRISQEIVADLFEGFVNPETIFAGCTQANVLRPLSIFAKLNPLLFSRDQIKHLEVFFKNVKTTDDVELVGFAAMLYRFVLPQFSNLEQRFVENVWKEMSGNLSKLAQSAFTGNISGKNALVDVVRCLWIMRSFAEKGVAKLLQAVASTLVQAQLLVSLAKDATAQAEQKKKIGSYLILLGTFGKVYDLKEIAAHFHASVSAMAKKFVDDKRITCTEDQVKVLLKPVGPDPSLTLLEVVRPFTKQSWDLTIREIAYCSLGEICQGSPGLFQRTDVETTFKVVFKNDITTLKQIALTQFHDFFVRAERRSDNEPTSSAENATNGTERLGITFQAGDGQVTTNYLARKFLHDVVDIALKNDNDLALMATSIITSISRQGLVHPKECGPALIALGSSSNTQIAQVAAIEHKEIHTKHESMFEKEYMAAFKIAFDYQQEVFHDFHGMVAPPACKPKMLHVFNVMKNGSRKTLKRFIDNLSKLMDFELPKIEESFASLNALLFARFCLENLALFDVPKLEDVAIITNTLENTVLKHTGPGVGVAIDTEVPKKATPASQLQSLPGGHDLDVNLLPMQVSMEAGKTISDARLLQISRACVILQMMWETRGFIRRAYNLHNLLGRIPHKDYQKPASRNNLINGKDLWERFELLCNSLGDRDGMIKHCHDFAELLDVDKDAQFGEEEEDGAEGYVTPDEADEPGVPSSGKGRKRKSSAPLSNTPKKVRGRSSGAKSKKQNSKTPDIDGWE